MYKYMQCDYLIIDGQNYKVVKVKLVEVKND